MECDQEEEPMNREALRIGSPAADFGKTRLRKTTFSTKWPPHPRAEGGQVEPVLGAL
jgi:hypothetical protein